MNKARHILLIDDNEVDNFIAERIIKVNNAAEAVTIKKSAVSALDFLDLQAKETGQFPDYILLDINMPVMDAFSFLREFSKFPESLKADCSVIVLTSSEDVRDKEKALRNPLVKDFLQKPLTLRIVNEILNNKVV